MLSTELALNSIPFKLCHHPPATRALYLPPQARLPEEAAPAPSLPFLLEHLSERLLQEFRRSPLVHVEVVLDVAVAHHEVLADLDALQVPGAQARHHVHVLDALVGISASR